MSDLGPTLIRSKLQIPAPSGLLHRAQLCDAIEQGLERKLTLISAPAGYGKTSALIDFSRHTRVPVCWYTVDERDRDLSLFIRYIIGALRERFPGFGKRAREALASRSGDLFRDPTTVVSELVNEMLDLETEFVLVLDNFEPVEGAFGIRGFLRRWLEVLPGNCHLMIGSRVLPDVPVTQLVARRQLVGLTERDLRFQPREIVELLQGSQIQISEGEAEVIARRAEGWITGILLISDLLREDAGSAIAGTGRATSRTYGYLVAEVLDRQPWEIRRFLLVSSILREMSPQLCRGALDLERARFLLTEVERRNLFVTRFGDAHTASYRYHSLFRDFLQERLRNQEPARYTELHQRAADWFKQEHQVEEAIDHYLAADVYPQATALMERVALEWFTRGRIETLLHWADALPERIKSQAPRLLLYQSKALTDWYEYDQARKALAHAEKGFVASQNTVQQAAVHIQLATLNLFESSYEQAISEAERALEMLAEREIPEQGHGQRLIGRAYLAQGEFARGTAELEEALELYREVGSPYDVVNVLQDLTLAFASQGRFREAAAYLNEALPIARQLDSPTLLAGVLNNLGMLHFERGDYEKALSLHQDGLAVARRFGDARSEAALADGMATIYRDAGVYRAAESLYDVAWRIAEESRPDQAVEILVARADMYRWQGDKRRALDLLEQAEEIGKRNDLEASRRGILALGKGVALAESGDLETGVPLVESAVAFLEQQGAQRNLAKGYFLLAKARLLANEEQEAVADLRRAMRLADEIGTIQFAVAEGQHDEGLVELGVTESIAGCQRLHSGIERLRAFGEGLVQELAQPREEPGRRLEIFAFGEGRVVREGRVVPGSAWQAAMARELFFYILFHGPVERDTVGLVFWPDLPAEKVTSNFHSTLYRVRRAVGTETIVVRGGKYQVGDIDYWCDVEEFELVVERARLLPPHDWQTEELWKQAVDLYRGDLLMGVDRAWCIPKREALRATYVEALIGIGRCCETRRAFMEAITWYRRALETDRLREDIHRRIMRCFAEIGRRSKALAQYDLCREILHQELGVDPAPETVVLYEEIAAKQRA